MVLMKMFVAINLTKLQRFESRANEEKTATVRRRSKQQNVSRKVRGSGKISNGFWVKFSTDVEHDVSFAHTGLSSPLWDGDFRT